MTTRMTTLVYWMRAAARAEKRAPVCGEHETSLIRTRDTSLNRLVSNMFMGWYKDAPQTRAEELKGLVRHIAAHPEWVRPDMIPGCDNPVVERLTRVIWEAKHLFKSQTDVNRAVNLAVQGKYGSVSLIALLQSAPPKRQHWEKLKLTLLYTRKR